MGRDFSQRSREAELMDTEVVDIDDYRACLRDLSTVNALTLTHGPLLQWLDRATSNLPPDQQVTILDVGFGYGDLLRQIHAWSLRRGRSVNLIGVDLNPWSEEIARAVTPPGIDIDYRTGNVFDFSPEEPIDFVISSQTTHHLTDDEVVAFIQWMEHVASRGWFIADLHRHALPFHAFKLLSRLARWHRFVQHDGPVSIARSFRKEEWVRILNTAGISLSAVRIRWHVPFRICVSRLR